MLEHNGIAPGVGLIDYKATGSAAQVTHALDDAYMKADVANISMAIGSVSLSGDDVHLCRDLTTALAVNLVIDEAVDRGLVVVTVAGNIDPPFTYNSIYNPGCSRNVITVGGINDRAEPHTMYNASGRGPTFDMVLKPELVAPAVELQVLSDYTATSTFESFNGTSIAAAQVSAASALIKQVQPNFTPVGVKASLLVGANWTGPVPCTASEYENGGTGLCSHDYRPVSTDLVYGAESLSVLNSVGFGILNVSKSLEYVYPEKSHVVLAEGESIFYPDQTYRIHAGEGEQVKVILSWLIHPRGTILNPLEPIALPGSAQFHNYDLAVVFPDGTRMNSNSIYQTNEFVVFDAPEGGHYIIVVSSADRVTTTLYEPYALASTHEIETGPFDLPEPNNPPTISLTTTASSPSTGDAVRIDATVGDADDDEVTIRWHVTQADIDISLLFHNNAVSFVVPPHRTITSATFEITATASDSKESTEASISITADIDKPPKINTVDESF